MAKRRITDKDKGFKKILKELKLLEAKPFVKVGVQGTDAEKDKMVRNDDGTITTVSGITVVEIATYQEYGVLEKPRSFLRDTIDINRNKYVAIVEDLKKEITRGEMKTMPALRILGQKIVSDIKARIKAGIPPKLSEETIKNKTVNGRKGTTPLIDTGQLYQSITYVVEAKS